MADFHAEKVFVEKGELLAALYDADAITMDGVRIINQFPDADVAPVRRLPDVKCPYCGEMVSLGDWYYD